MGIIISTKGTENEFANYSQKARAHTVVFDRVFYLDALSSMGVVNMIKNKNMMVETKLYHYEYEDMDVLLDYSESEEQITVKIIVAGESVILTQTELANIFELSRRYSNARDVMEKES